MNSDYAFLFPSIFKGAPVSHQQDLIRFSTNNRTSRTWQKSVTPAGNQVPSKKKLFTIPSATMTKNVENITPGMPGKRFYDFEPEQIEAIRIRHCRVDTEEMCQYVHSQVVTGKASLTELAKNLSTCVASKNQGGDLGWWWRNEEVPSDVDQFGITSELLGAALRTRLNTIDTLKTPYGWHVFVVEETRHTLRTTHKRNSFQKKPMSNRYRAKQESISPPTDKTYALHTLGCQMNRSDSERMAGELIRMGYTEIEDPFKASVLVLNTCNIRDHAEKKVYSYLGRHVQRKQQYPEDVTLCVAGCVAQQEGEKMLRRIPELDLVFGPQYVNRLGDLLKDVETNRCQVAATDPIHIQEDITKPKRESSVTAWVNVMFGCGENCTFCTVGNVVRAVEQSRTMDAIRKEVEDIAKDGIREIILLGQNIDAYGRDMHPRKKFADLLRHIHDVDGIERIRFTTSHPRYISENLVTTCAELPKVMPYFHIPPQSGDNVVLDEMKRGYTAERFKNIVKRIRNYIPDAAICGDMIVGFPGETEEQFQNSIKLLNDVRFDSMNTAAYSPRPKTPAAAFANQIPEAVKADRLQRMNDIVTMHARERSQRYVGRIEHVLVEQENPKDNTQVFGRNPGYRSVYFAGSIKELKGKIVPVKIEIAFPFCLQGIQVGEPY